MPLRLEQISAAQLEALPKRQTVFFFPVGVVEDHGPHLPMGLDLMEAERLSLLAAERIEQQLMGWKTVIMPVAPLSIDGNTTALAITVRAHVLRDWLVDGAHSLYQAGFRHFICFSGQLGPRQLTAIEEAARILRRRVKKWGVWPAFGENRPIFMSASSALVTKGVTSSSPLWPDPKEHGGKRDTSIALHLVPGLVDPGYARLLPISRGKTLVHRWVARARRTLRGYWGAPAEADAPSGGLLLQQQVEDVFPKIRAALEGSKPEALFRSWYSIYPSNKSFFKAWILATFLMVLIIIWIYFAIIAMTTGL